MDGTQITAWWQDGPEERRESPDVVTDIIAELRATTDATREAELFLMGLEILRRRAA